MIVLHNKNKSFTFVKSNKKRKKSSFKHVFSMKDRIRQVMELQRMTQQEFAQFIDVSPASLSSIFNGRTKPTLNIVEAIKKKISNINTDWLMFGSGSMYMSDNGNAVVRTIPEEHIYDIGGKQEVVAPRISGNLG